MGSVLLSFLGVLGAYGAVDYGFYRSLGPELTAYQGGELSDKAMIACAVAAGCLFVAAAAGRLSGLGPLLAGLVLGAGPCAWIALDHASYVARANDIPEMWNHTSFGLVGAAVVLYPTVAGLLIGAAVRGSRGGAPRSPPPPASACQVRSRLTHLGHSLTRRVLLGSRSCGELFVRSSAWWPRSDSRSSARRAPSRKPAAVRPR